MMLEIFDPSSTKPARSALIGVELSDDATECLPGSPNVRSFIDRLVEGGLEADALAVIAQRLPSEYVVPWGCECLRLALQHDGPGSDMNRTGLALAEQCLKAPTEDNWRMCQEFADSDGYRTPGAWIAAAAGWSQGSLAPAGVDAVRSAPQAIGEAVLAALKLSAAQKGVDGARQLANHARRALSLFGQL